MMLLSPKNDYQVLWLLMAIATVANRYPADLAVIAYARSWENGGMGCGNPPDSPAV
jgi:hypothetical protein